MPFSLDLIRLCLFNSRCLNMEGKLLEQFPLLSLLWEGVISDVVIRNLIKEKKFVLTEIEQNAFKNNTSTVREFRLILKTIE